MKRIWVNKASSFKEAEEFDARYYRAMSETERLETMQFLRDVYRKIKEWPKHESRRRLRRVVRIIQ